MSRPDPQRPVRRRRVFFIPGYDPVAPRAYRERYRREAARQADFSGHEIALSPGGPSDGYGWRVDARIEGQGVETTVEVLHWADIVRASMARGVVAGYAELGRTAWIYLSSGALFRLMRLRKGPVIAALYPVVVLLGELVLAVALGAGTGLALHAAARAGAGPVCGGRAGHRPRRGHRLGFADMVSAARPADGVVPDA
jgi:hypothetical protein